MIKIVLINHTFQKPEYYKRWKALSEKYSDLDITLIAPREWSWGVEKNLTYGKVEKVQGTIICQERFRIRLIDVKRDFLGEWDSKDLELEILRNKPDLVYFIGGHTAKPLMKILNLRKKNHLFNMKVIAFSMRGTTPTVDFKKSLPGVQKYINYIGKTLILKPRLLKFHKYCDAVFCHYPDALNAFRLDGFKKAIYIQTQVGVDPDIFYPNEESRNCIRERYNIGDSYLFGSASRFHKSKGLLDIINALPINGDWKYLMMGWGLPEEVEEVKSLIKQRNLEHKIILTGYIESWSEMAEHWNALDCAIHTPRTTLRWEETFSLALIQAMITGLPVIGNTSGSVPYQVGTNGILVNEGDLRELNEKMEYMINHKEYGLNVGKRMRKRALECFSIYHLNDCFYESIKDVLNNIYDIEKLDMSNFSARSFVK